MSKISLTLHDLSVDVAAQILAMLGGSFNAAIGAALSTPDEDEDDTPPAAGANVPAVDSTGLPWDERIHAKAKTQSADGKWKRARKVSDEFVRSIELELRARAAPPVPQAQPVFTPPAQPGVPNYGNPQATVAEPPAGYPAAPPVTATPQQSAPSVSPPAPIPTPQQPMNEFTTLMNGISRALTAGTFNQDSIAAWVHTTNSAWGTNFQNVTELKDRPEICTWVMQSMQAANQWPAG